MSRLTSCLSNLAQQQRKALVPYIVAGDTVVADTVVLMHQLTTSGADIIELGVPFSDPMAEGTTIQLAHERALTKNTSLLDVLAMVAKFREQDKTTPVVLMGYCNPIESLGYAEFAKLAAQSGVDGVLTVDMPPEEAQDFNAELKKVAIDNIYLIAPTTTEQRIEKIVSLASGYLYYVSLKGVTGSAALEMQSVIDKMQLIQQKTALPVCVGFGIKDTESAKQVAQIASGAVVGSALIDKMARAANPQQALHDVAEFCASLRAAIDAVSI